MMLSIQIFSFYALCEQLLPFSLVISEVVFALRAMDDSITFFLDL
jgi:hypothetical protein